MPYHSILQGPALFPLHSSDFDLDFGFNTNVTVVMLCQASYLLFSMLNFGFHPPHRSRNLGQDQSVIGKSNRDINAKVALVV